jgi:hypothetical protein
MRRGETTTEIFTLPLPVAGQNGKYHQTPSGESLRGFVFPPPTIDAKPGTGVAGWMKSDTGRPHQIGAVVRTQDAAVGTACNAVHRNLGLRPETFPSHAGR